MKPSSHKESRKSGPSSRDLVFRQPLREQHVSPEGVARAAQGSGNCGGAGISPKPRASVSPSQAESEEGACSEDPGPWDSFVWQRQSKGRTPCGHGRLPPAAGGLRLPSCQCRDLQKVTSAAGPQFVHLQSGDEKGSAHQSHSSRREVGSMRASVQSRPRLGGRAAAPHLGAQPDPCPLSTRSTDSSLLQGLRGRTSLEWTRTSQWAPFSHPTGSLPPTLVLVPLGSEPKPR